MIEIEQDTLLAGVTALTLCWVTWHGHRIGSERRDVALLAVLSALCLVGAGATLVL